MELGKLPGAWVWTTVAELGKVVSGGTPSTKEAGYWGGDIAWISPSDLTGYTGKFIARGAKSISAAGLQNSSATVMPAGSVHFSSRAPVGYTVISSRDMTTNQGFKSLAPANGVFNEYIYYYFKSAKQLAESLATGTTFKEISGSAFSKMPVPLPPTAEQHRIVAKIDELFSELDQGVASLKTAREQLKVYRQSLLKNAFAGKLTAAWRAAHADQLETAAALQQRIARERAAGYQQQLADWQTAGQSGSKPKPPKHLPPLTPEELAKLPELPAGWGWFKVNHLCDVVRGGSPRPAGDPKYYGGNIPFLKVADITRTPSPYLSSYSFTITEAGLSKTRQIEPNTLLLSNSGATLGVPKICLISATMNDGVAAFLGLPIEQLLYHYYFWQSQTEKLRNIDQGAAQPNLNTDLIKETLIPICSSAEQSIVTERLEAALSEADQLDQTLATALQQAEALRQSILKKAFCGQLVKQDKNEEPATALLERIRASRGASSTKGRQAKLGSKPLPNC